MKKKRVGRPLKLPGLNQVRWIVENKIGKEEIDRLIQNQELIRSWQIYDSKGRISTINSISLDFMQRAIDKFNQGDECWEAEMSAFLFANAIFRNQLYELMGIDLLKEDYFNMCQDEEDLILCYIIGQGVLAEQFGTDEIYKNVRVFDGRVKPIYRIDLVAISNKERVVHIIEVKNRCIRNGDIQQVLKYIDSIKGGSSLDVPQITRVSNYKIHIALIGVDEPKRIEEKFIDEVDIYFFDNQGKLHHFQPKKEEN